MAALAAFDVFVQRPAYRHLIEGTLLGTVLFVLNDWSAGRQTRFGPILVGN
jgi:hypothetical protein